MKIPMHDEVGMVKIASHRIKAKSEEVRIIETWKCETCGKINMDEAFVFVFYPEMTFCKGNWEKNELVDELIDEEASKYEPF